MQIDTSKPATCTKVIQEGHIEVDVDHDLSFERDPVRRGKIILRDLEEMKSKLEQLRGVRARIVTTTFNKCSNCKYGFEVDEETGLTACCGSEIAA